MFSTALISLRETFETSLILCVILTYLAQRKEERAAIWVWMGTGIGVVWSIGMAIGLTIFASFISHEFEEIYEGSMMLLATGLLSWMILWMASQGRSMKRSLENEMQRHISTGYAFGIALTAFLAVAREGTELVLLTHAALLSSTDPILGLFGSGIGIALALGLAWILVRSTKLLPVGLFFTVTGAFLIVVSALLLRHGVHEFMEAGVIAEYASIDTLAALLYATVILGIWYKISRR